MKPDASGNTADGRLAHLSRPDSTHPWARGLVEKTLAPFDIRINGQRLSDIRVLDEAFYRRALVAGEEGILDAYVDGWWVEVGDRKV